MARLNLVVLRAHDPARLAAFYSSLGLSFIRHRHGAGPEHFASENGAPCLKSIPLAKPTGEPAGALQTDAIANSRSDYPRIMDFLEVTLEMFDPSSDSGFSLRKIIG